MPRKPAALSLPELLSSRQTADALGVSSMTILRWVADGSLPSIGRLGSGPNAPLIFTREAVEALRLERTQ